MKAELRRAELAGNRWNIQGDLPQASEEKILIALGLLQGGGRGGGGGGGGLMATRAVPRENALMQTTTLLGYSDR